MIKPVNKHRPYRRWLCNSLRLLLVTVSIAGALLALVKPPYYFMQTIRSYNSRNRTADISGQYMLYRSHAWIWDAPSGKYSDLITTKIEILPYLDVARLAIYEMICLFVCAIGWFVPKLLLKYKRVVVKPLRKPIIPSQP